MREKMKKKGLRKNEPELEATCKPLRSFLWEHWEDRDKD